MLGLCPLLAIVESAGDGLLFGGFFVIVFCLSMALAFGFGPLMSAPVRQLFFPLSVSMSILGVGFLEFSPFYKTVTGYGVYVGLIATNCLILDHMQVGFRELRIGFRHFRLVTLSGSVWVFFVAFGALREVLSTGHIHVLTSDNEGCLVGMPFAVSPAGAFILLGLIAAGGRSLRVPTDLDTEVFGSDKSSEPVP